VRAGVEGRGGQARIHGLQVPGAVSLLSWWGVVEAVVGMVCGGGGGGGGGGGFRWGGVATRFEQPPLLLPTPRLLIRRPQPSHSIEPLFHTKSPSPPLFSPSLSHTQETKTITTARKVMESRGVVHYFDMVVNVGSDGLGVGM
jgi:hypothetical protein